LVGISGTSLKSVDCWSIGKDLHRETIIRFFEFYSSFDKFAFSFEEIDNSSFDTELFVQNWKENRTHTARKEACLQKLKEKTEILYNNKRINLNIHLKVWSSEKT
jgi:hypothetical protein